MKDLSMKHGRAWVLKAALARRTHFGVSSRKLLDKEYGVGLREDGDFWIMLLKKSCGRI